MILAGVLLWMLMLNAAWARAAVAQELDNQPALDISAAGDKASLLPYMDFLLDPQGQLTIGDVVAAHAAGGFVPAGSTIPNLGLSDSVTWVHVALANPGSRPVPAVLNFDAPEASFVDLYADPTTGSQEPDASTGAQRPYAARPLPARSFAFPVEVPPAATADYYLRVASNSPTYLNLEFWLPAAFAASNEYDRVLWGTLIGMLLLMSAYNLLLYITLRDGKHLLLVAFGLLVATSSALAGGYASLWLPPSLVGHWLELTLASIVAVIAAFFLVAMSFLELRQRVRPAFWAMVAALLMLGPALPLTAFGKYLAAYAVIFAALLPGLLVILAATIVRIRQGSRLALFLLLGQSAAILFGILQSLSVLGIGPPWPRLSLLVPSDSLFFLMIMSLALADRINILRREADQSNAALTASEQRLKTYLDALPFNVQVHDAELKPLYVNSAIRKLSGDRPEGWFEQDYEHWRKEYHSYIAGTDQLYPVEQLPLIRAARGEYAHADDVTVVGPHGQRTTVESWAVPLRNTEGKVMAIVTAFQDITQRRATEEELASYRDHLEQRVAQRTAELATLNASLAARVAELTAINDVGRCVARIGNTRAVLDEVAQILTDVFQVTGAAITLFGDNQSTMQVVVIAGGDGEDLQRYEDQVIAYDAAAGYAAHHTNPAVLTDPARATGLPPEIRDALHELGIVQLLVAPLVAREQHIGVLALLSKDAERSFTADELRVAQTVAGQVATAIDTVQLIDEVRRQRDLAEALRQTATALSRDLDQQNVLGTILEQVDLVFTCEGAAVALVEGNELVTAAAKGFTAACIGRRSPLDGTTAGTAVLHSRQPLIVDDASSDGGSFGCLDNQQLRSWLGVPLISGDDVIGVLSLASTAAGSFNEQHASLLTTFANQAAIAVVNARLYDQAQALAIAGERNRIARDLHDAVTQTIFSASLLASALPARLPDLPAAAQADVDALQLLARGALAEMRTLLLELRPEQLVQVQLDVLLTHLAQAFAGRNGVPVDTNLNCDPLYAPPYAVKIAFYRVAQEALNNIGKHTKAAHVTIRFSSRPGTLHLAVIDDGQGFDMQTVGPEKMGLAIMQERAATVGAQLTLDSEPGLGTHLFMVWTDDNNTQTN